MEKTESNSTPPPSGDAGGEDVQPYLPPAYDPLSLVEGGLEEKAAGDEAEEPVKDQESVAGEAAADAVVETPAAGTPDKVLQRMQQDLSAATRKLEELSAKADAGQPLTPKETQQVAKAQRKLESIRADLAAKGAEIDVLDHGDAIAETLIEQDQTLADVNRRLAAQEAELNQLRAERQQAQTQSNWSEVEKLYPKVDLKSTWENSVAEALEMTGISAEQAQGDPRLMTVARNAANRIFHARASAAAKSVAAKAPEAKTNKTTTRSNPPVTPGGARVVQKSGVSPTGEVDEAAEYRRKMLALVAED